MFYYNNIQPKSHRNGTSFDIYYRVVKFFLVARCILYIAGLVEGTWEPSIETPFPLRYLFSPPSAAFRRYCVLSGGTQRRTCLVTRGIEIWNISFPRVWIKPTNCPVYSFTLVPLRNDFPHYVTFVCTSCITFCYNMLYFTCINL